ncbi:MAG: AbrB/MazE/SpoVT family DNA-binding domain-containing protein [Thermoplasmata archaeon]
MNLRYRKVFRSGDSVCVALPQDWLRGNQIGPGDEVEIRYNGDVRVRPKRRAESS